MELLGITLYNASYTISKCLSSIENAGEILMFTFTASFFWEYSQTTSYDYNVCITILINV